MADQDFCFKNQYTAVTAKGHEAAKLKLYAEVHSARLQDRAHSPDVQCFGCLLRSASRSCALFQTTRDSVCHVLGVLQALYA
jgi:putative NADPH-quinone reductase